MADRAFPRTSWHSAPWPARTATTSACSMKSCVSTKTSASAFCAKSTARSGLSAEKISGTGPRLQRGHRRHPRIPRAFRGSGFTTGRQQNHRLRSRRHGTRPTNGARPALPGVRHQVRPISLRGGPRRRRPAHPHRVGEFANLDLPRLRQELKYPIVIDGRNLYDPEVMAAHGFTYYSIGRAAAQPAPALKNTIKNEAIKNDKTA